MNETTTDLKELKAKIKPFTWGKLIKFHKIAEYDLVEFHPYVYENYCGTNRINYKKTEYLCYINSKDIGHSAYSIDEALAICIAYKHDGSNSQAAGYFMKMISKEI